MTIRGTGLTLYNIDIETLIDFAGENARSHGTGKSVTGNMSINCTVAFRYVDREGNETLRMVEPRRVWRTKDKDQLMLLGWCYTRKSPRTFYYDGIRDICTGGVGLEYLRHRQKDIGKVETSIKEKDMRSYDWNPEANDHPYKICVETFRTKIKLYGRHLELAKGPPRDEKIADDAIMILKDIENSLYLALDTAYLDGKNDGLINAPESQ
tara:strand:+ start:266 stop:895 length:630 start_codon:yes stop_codon:yes gene_type:complete